LRNILKNLEGPQSRPLFGVLLGDPRMPVNNIQRRPRPKNPEITGF
jgi:hypothetical protein